jgi:hypothetical protein
MPINILQMIHCDVDFEGARRSRVLIGGPFDFRDALASASFCYVIASPEGVAIFHEVGRRRLRREFGFLRPGDCLRRSL